MTDKEKDIAVANLILLMERNAEAAPNLELTPKNWLAEFGENGIVQTPIGEVKMGDNQYLKMGAKNRGAEFGMVKPTLANPDVIIEEKDSRENVEREYVLLFVKSFIISDRKITHFESVTVSKDGNEVVVSNHIVNKGALKNKLSQNPIIYASPANGSEMRLAKNQLSGLPDIVPTQTSNASDHKGNTFSSKSQGKSKKKFV